MTNKTNSNWLQATFILLLLLVYTGLFHSCQKDTRMDALIITGQTSTDREASTEALVKIMENSELFAVEVARSPAEGEDMGGFSPDFSAYDLVVLNDHGNPWPDETTSAFTDYVKSGGGVVVYLSASMALPDWPEYTKIPGKTGKPEGTKGFLVVHQNPEHPILQGLPDSWLHGNGELYGTVKNPAENCSILATAFSDTAYGGTGRDEPVLFTMPLGEGRIFHVLLGYPAAGNIESPLHCAGFVTIFLRGAEWAATGTVTQPVHPDFPNSASAFFWEDYQPLSLEELMNRIATYEIGKSRKYLADLKNRIRKSDGALETLLRFEKEMVNVLESDATAECKKQLCRELSWMGSEYSVPALEKLTEDPEVAEMAEFALERLIKQ